MTSPYPSLFSPAFLYIVRIFLFFITFLHRLNPPFPFTVPISFPLFFLARHLFSLRLRFLTFSHFLLIFTFLVFLSSQREQGLLSQPLLVARPLMLFTWPFDPTKENNTRRFLNLQPIDLSSVCVHTRELAVKQITSWIGLYEKERKSIMLVEAMNERM